MTAPLLLWLSLSGWPTGENLSLLQERAAEVYLDKLFERWDKNRSVPSRAEVEAIRLERLDLKLRFRARLVDTIKLLDLAPLLTDDPKQLEYYRIKQEEFRRRLVETECDLLRLQKPATKIPKSPRE